MRVKSIHLRNFKRFTDLLVHEIPDSARLVMLTGPNGSGKSAVFEGFNWWRRHHGGWGQPRDPTYFPKLFAENQPPSGPAVDVQFHGGQPQTRDDQRRSFWIRSAYRHEADFTSTALQRQPSHLEDAGLDRLIMSEAAVRRNYERLASLGLQALYDPDNQAKRVGELQEQFVGPLRRAMGSVFEELALRTLGNPVDDGSFYFRKGASEKFHYKNLSAGEKAAFDLLLDFFVRQSTFNNTVFCIDEPELHIGTRLQARLLCALFDALPGNCQLWLATHSVGMMREAVKLKSESDDSVVFIDTSDQDFDGSAILVPTQPNRAFMARHLKVALADLAELVAPRQLVLCEGASVEDGFDAACYSAIFGDHVPDAEFMSVGNSSEVKNDRLGVASAFGMITPGVQVIQVVDRDDHTDEERNRNRAAGVKMLRRRNIESYLLDDAILEKLCAEHGRPELADELKADRQIAIADATGRGKVADDYKQARQAVHRFARTKLGITQSGSTVDEFFRSFVAPLITPDTDVYRELHSDIFA